MREHWELLPRQRLSPGWQEMLVFTITAMTSYESAALSLNKLGHCADDSVLHALAQRMGEQAQQQVQERLEQCRP